VEVPTAADCKRSVEIEIPLEEVEKTKERVTSSLRQRVRLPGFRPGKAPLSMIQSRFESDIRNEVLEMLLPQAFREKVDKGGYKVVGQPNITDLKFEAGQPIHFKAAFEVAPEFEIAEYRGLAAKYEEPQVSDEEVNERLEKMRTDKVEYVNLDPRPIEAGDFVLVHLKSLAGLAEAISQDVQIEVSGTDTLPAFTEALVGMNPDETKTVDIAYGEDYGQENLAGKTVKFELTPKTLRRKELPALDDEFAADLGDFKSLDELKEALRKTIFSEKQFKAQRIAKEEIIDKLVEANQFPIPEVYIDRQVENQVRTQLNELAGQGVDPNTLKLDWAKVKEAQQEKAIRNVRASLLLEKIAEKEGIHTTKEEVDVEVQRVARREHEALPVTRAKLEKDGALARISSHIQSEKTLQFLFENAKKYA
jgi:trigger factor